ncbi:MAG: short-chain fatty acyl-CoA regulator family protein [Beijerinckiaceae bacterium]|nr:short-chain fatty acyl-CoA regulator family protein [Beijerinckiaceae bacterium]
MRQKIFAGTKIRHLREGNSLNQGAFAERLGISPSYLNQIENNQRPLTAPVLLALAQTFSVDIGGFVHEDTERLVSDLREALADPVFAGLMPNGQDLKTIAANVPWFAHAFLSMHVAFRRTGERLHMLDEVYASGQEGERQPGVLMPYEEVRDFLHYRSNYFEGLDVAAEELAEQIFGSVAARADNLASHLFKRHSIRIETEKVEPSSRFMRRLDRKTRVLWLREGIDPSTAIFLMAQQIGLLEQTEEIEAIVTAAGFRTPDAAAITRLALGNYFAGAVLMPYERFLAAARATRYDAERLCSMFGTSFEQVGHRFSTLQKPNAKGVPFYFVRFDRAGNIIKRHSSTRFQFARFGGTCPLWNVHEAFEAYGKTLVQIAEMPDGVRYLCVARAVTKSGGSHLAPPRHYALGIGCELIHAQDVVYADTLDLKTAPVTLIGVSCRMCERMDCPHRAAPPIDRALTVDPDRRDFVPFKFS